MNIRYGITKQRHFVFVLSELEVPIFDTYTACDFSLVPFDLDKDWTKTKKAYLAYDPENLSHIIVYFHDMIEICNTFEELNYASYVFDYMTNERSKVYLSIMHRIQNPK